MSARNVAHSDDWEAGKRDPDQRFLAATSNKDVDGAMSCFLNSPDLVAVLWGNELRGRWVYVLDHAERLPGLAN